ncbi:hypothetical protein EC845_2530 [Comamonas sp. BIGb0124]|uniref:hypothetical protein n=1 Tax=Comamonas sp. BIGb0124 TaxID=2485130 RepID=UPI000F485E76|nr:hypothetical protein [Comamonas sp. BIGb0124]ROR21708.1 hypothetical protein EC845_2530 [Comamonas sp. BIGb0124]
MTFTNNTTPAGEGQRPKPIDRRFEDPEAMLEAVVRRVIGNAAPPSSSADPIRDMVTNALEMAGIPTAGKSDSQLLADYTEQLRQSARTVATAARNSQAHNEFAGYDMNDPRNEGKA